MSSIIDIGTFFTNNKELPVIDVRSPSEYRQGHINGAINIPLFSDNERDTIGKLYKLSGQREATLKGLEFAGRKIRQLADSGIEAAEDKELILYCWRGGMRSLSMSWLFETCGIKCYILKGGYKTFRAHIHSFFSQPIKFIVIGGMTGSGKTAILNELRYQSYQVLDLEMLAHHKGSAFGSLGQTPQNTNEQFENDLFTTLSKFNLSEPVFLEDESRNIGQNIIPQSLFDRISISPTIIVEMSKEHRIERLLEEYGKYTKSELSECTSKLIKRLGGAITKQVQELIEKGELRESMELILNYYDKTYQFSISRKKSKIIIPVKIVLPDPSSYSVEILKVLKEYRII